MGGSAFSSKHQLFTPRMPRNVYEAVRERCHSTLREEFVCVATPIEGPGKSDFGDIEILVALERRLIFPRPHEDQALRKRWDVLQSAAWLLGANPKHVIPDHGGGMHVAIPWPEDLPTANDAAAGPSAGARHIQVDVRICDDVDSLCFHLFHHAHGDLWNLLGSTIRPFGLTVDESAMWIRIPEIEALDKKKARVLLTKDSVEMLHFLGMRVEGYWEQAFATAEEMFDYASTCRLFWVKERSDEDVLKEGDANAVNAYSEAEVGMTGGAEGRRKLKANDRKRMNSRPMFRQWIEGYIPRCRAEGRAVRDMTASVEQIREGVRAEAFRRFPAVEIEWNARLLEWRQRQTVAEAARAIAEAVPTHGADGNALDPSFRGCAVSACKKIIMENNDSYGVTAPVDVRGRDGIYDLATIKDFVKHNWEGVSGIAWEKQMVKAAEARRLKELKRSAA